MTIPTPTITWSERRVSVQPGDEVAVTVRELDSGVPGPRVLVLGGVHGDEVGGIVAAGRASVQEWPLISGSLVIVPVAHEAARASNTRVSPLDGGNLARTFPGRLGGTATEQLAWLITHRLLSRCDLLIDLHTSNAATDMPLFVGCLDDGSPEATRAVELALKSGMPMVWTHPELGPGRTLTTARELSIPALYVESPVGGVLDETHLAAYAQFIRSTLLALGMIDGEPEKHPVPLWLHGNGDVDTFTAAGAAGLFLRETRLMSRVRRGDRVGLIVDELGRERETVTAPRNGYVTTLQRSAVISAGQPLVGVTGVRPPALSFASDAFSREGDRHE